MLLIIDEPWQNCWPPKQENSAVPERLSIFSSQSPGSLPGRITENTSLTFTATASRDLRQGVEQGLVHANAVIRVDGFGKPEKGKKTGDV